MRYTKTYWHHQLEDSPILYISAFDNNEEVYRVEIFSDGRRLYADKTNTPNDEAYLYGITITEVLAFNNPNDELFSVEISEQEFNHFWKTPENIKYNKSD